MSQIEDEVMMLMVAAKAQQTAVTEAIAKLDKITAAIAVDRKHVDEQTKGLEKLIYEAVEEATAESVASAMGAHKKALEAALNDAEDRVNAMGNNWTTLLLMVGAGLLGACMGSTLAYFLMQHEHVITVQQVPAPQVQEQIQQPQPQRKKR